MGAALRAGHFDCVKLLIESGVSVDRTVLSGSAKKQVNATTLSCAVLPKSSAIELGGMSNWMTSECPFAAAQARGCGKDGLVYFRKHTISLPFSRGHPWLLYLRGSEATLAHTPRFLHSRLARVE